MPNYFDTEEDEISKLSRDAAYSDIFGYKPRQAPSYPHTEDPYLSYQDLLAESVRRRPERNVDYFDESPRIPTREQFNRRQELEAEQLALRNGAGPLTVEGLLTRAQLGWGKFQSVDLPRMVGGAMNAYGRMKESGARRALERGTGIDFIDRIMAPKLQRDVVEGENLKRIGREASTGAKLIERDAEKGTGGVGGGFVGDLTEGVVRSSGSMLPTIPAAIVGGVPLAATVAGLQSFTGTFADAADAYEARGMKRDEAESKAFVPAIASGLVTGLITRLGGSTGLEKYFTRQVGKEAGKVIVKKGFIAAAKELAKDFGLEAVEEGGDQAWQSVIGELSFRPEMTAKDALNETMMAALAGGLLTVVPGTAKHIFEKAEAHQPDNYFAPPPVVENKGRFIAPPPVVNKTKQQLPVVVELNKPESSGNTGQLPQNLGTAIGAKYDGIDPGTKQWQFTKDGFTFLIAPNATADEIVAKVTSLGKSDEHGDKNFSVDEAIAEAQKLPKSAPDFQTYLNDAKKNVESEVQELRSLWPEISEGNARRVVLGAPFSESLQKKLDSLPIDRKQAIDGWFNEKDATAGKVIGDYEVANAAQSITDSGASGAQSIASELVSLMRRATQFSSSPLKEHITNLFRHAGDVAEKNGIPRSDLKKYLQTELVSIYGNDAAEMAEHYFGKPASKPKGEAGVTVAVPLPKPSKPVDKPVTVNGTKINIEYPAGSVRSGTDKNGNEWSVTMKSGYGRIDGVKSADGEELDAYVGPNKKAKTVYIVDQIDPDTGKFNEHKILTAFSSEAEAVAAYDAAFSDGSGPSRRGAVSKMSSNNFKNWIKTADTKKPFVYEKKVEPAQTPEPTSVSQPATPAPFAPAVAAPVQEIAAPSSAEKEQQAADTLINNVGFEEKPLPGADEVSNRGSKDKVVKEASFDITTPDYSDELADSLVSDSSPAANEPKTNTHRITFFENQQTGEVIGIPTYKYQGEHRTALLPGEKNGKKKFFTLKDRMASGEFVPIHSVWVKTSVSATNPNSVIAFEDAKSFEKKYAKAAKDIVGATARGAEAFSESQANTSPDEVEESGDTDVEAVEPAESGAHDVSHASLHDILLDSLPKDKGGAIAQSLDQDDVTQALFFALRDPENATVRNAMFADAIAELSQEPDYAELQDHEKQVLITETIVERALKEYEAIKTKEAGKKSGALVKNDSGQRRDGKQEAKTETKAPKPSPLADRLLAKLDSAQAYVNSSKGPRLNLFGGMDVGTANLVIEVVRAAIKTGVAVTNAIDAGIDWLKTNRPGAFDEESVREAFAQYIGSEKVQQSGTSVAQKAQHLIDSLKAKIADAETSKGKGLRAKQFAARVAKKVLKRRDIKANFITPMEKLSASIEKLGGIVTDWERTQSDATLTEAERSGATGKAMEAIDSLEETAQSFYADYEKTRQELIDQMEKSEEAAGENKNQVSSLNVLMDDFSKLLNLAIETTTIPTKMASLRKLVANRDGVRNIFDYLLRKSVPVEGMVSMGTGDRASVIAILETAAVAKFGTPEFRQAVGASDEAVNLFADFLIANKEMKDEFFEAKKMIDEEVSAGEVSEIKNAFAAAVKNDQMGDALNIFVDGVGKTAVAKQRAAGIANFFARKQRSALASLQALEETKKIYDAVRSDPDYRDMRSEVYKTQHVEDVIQTTSKSARTINFKAIPGKAEELSLRTNTDQSVFQEDKAKLEAYAAAAQDYIDDVDAVEYNEATANALKNFLRTYKLNVVDADPNGGRLLPSTANAPIRWVGSFFGGKHVVGNRMGRYVAGVAANLMDRTLRAYSTASRAVSTALNDHRSGVNLALKAALKSHDLTLEDYRTHVWNNFAGSQQYFDNVSILRAGDQIGNGYTVTKQDVALLKAVREQEKDVISKVHGTSGVKQAALQNFHSGVVEKVAGSDRLRSWFESGPGTTHRHWSRIKNLFHDFTNTKVKADFFEKNNWMIVPYLRGVYEPQLKASYQFSSEIKSVLDEDPISSLDDLVERITKKHNDAADVPMTETEVKDILVGEMSLLMGKVKKYIENDERSAADSSTNLFYGGESASNTARGAQLLPSGWYDYSALTDGEQSGMGASALQTFFIQHLEAVRLLNRELTEKVRELQKGEKKTGEDFYTLGQAETAKEQIGLYLSQLEKQMASADGKQSSSIMQYAQSSALANYGPSITNLFGGAYQYMLEAGQVRNRNGANAIGSSLLSVTNALVKDVIRGLASDANVGSRQIAKMLNHPKVRAATRDLTKIVADYAQREQDTAAELREAGMAGSAPKHLFRDLQALYANWATGGNNTDKKVPNVFSKSFPFVNLQKPRGAASTALKSAAMVITQPMSAIDREMNTVAQEAATKLEDVVQARIIKAMRLRGDSNVPLTNKELAGSFLPFAYTESAGARIRERFRHAEVDLQSAAAEFWKNYKAASDKETAEGVPAGTYTDEVRLLTQEQRNQLRFVTAEENNMSTPGSRLADKDRWWKTFLDYPISQSQRMYDLASRFTGSGKGGHLVSVMPISLVLVLGAAVAMTVGNELREWFRRKFQNKRSPLPMLSDWFNLSNKERAMIFARAAASGLPLYGTAFMQLTDSQVRNGFDLNSQFFQINLLSKFAGTLKEMFQTKSMEYPLMKFADSTIWPINQISHLLPGYEGIRESQSVNNILLAGSRNSGLESNIRSPYTGTIRYTPASPLLDRYVNAVGKGDIDGAREVFDDLVKYYDEELDDPAAAQKKALAAIKKRNPLAQKFNSAIDAGTLDKIYNSVSTEDANRVKKFLANYEAAASASAGKAVLATNSRSTRVKGEGSSGRSASSYVPSLSSVSMPSSGSSSYRSGSSRRRSTTGSSSRRRRSLLGTRSSLGRRKSKRTRFSGYGLSSRKRSSFGKLPSLRRPRRRAKRKRTIYS